MVGIGVDLADLGVADGLATLIGVGVEAGGAGLVRLPKSKIRRAEILVGGCLGSGTATTRTKSPTAAFENPNL